jgi:hypothetical protein
VNPRTHQNVERRNRLCALHTSTHEVRSTEDTPVNHGRLI